MSVSRGRREEGVAVLLVTVILVMTVTSVYAFARASLLDVMATRYRIDLARARMLADSGVEIAKRAIIDDALVLGHPLGGLETDLDGWALVSRTTIETAGGGELHIRIRDGGSRIDLNGLVNADGKRDAAAQGFLKALLQKIIDDLPGRVEEKPYDATELSEAILDWIDADPATALGDEEGTYYQGRGATGVPLDRPLLALEELGALPGMDPVLFAGLAAYFTTYPVFPGPANVGINPNTAPPHVLAAIYAPPLDPRDEGRFADSEDVFRILRARAEGRVFCLTQQLENCVTLQEAVDALAGGNSFPAVQLQSEIFEIESEGRFGEARAGVHVILDRSEPAALAILAYERK